MGLISRIRTIFRRQPSQPTQSTTINSPYSSTPSTATSNAGALQGGSSPSIAQQNVSTTNISSGVTTPGPTPSSPSTPSKGGGGGGGSVTTPQGLTSVASGSNVNNSISQQVQAKQLEVSKTEKVNSTKAISTYNPATSERQYINPYMQSKWDSVKQSGNQFFTNVKYSFQTALGFGEGKDKSWDSIWGGQSNVLKSFEYSSKPAGTKIIDNPLYVGGSDSGTININPKIEQKKTVSKQELYEAGYLPSSEVEGRSFSAPKTSKTIGTVSNIGLSVAVPQYGFVQASKGAYLGFGKSTNPNLTTKERIGGAFTGGLSLVGAGLFSSASFAKASKDLRGATEENLLNLDKKIPSTGKRIISGDTAKDTFSKNIKTELGSLESSGKVTSKLSGESGYVSGGMVYNKLTVKDYLTGKTLTSSNTNLVTSKGGLTSLSDDVTLGLGKTKSMNILRTDTSSTSKSTNIKADLFPEGFKPSAEYSAGLTKVQKGFVISKSGTLNKVEVNTISNPKTMNLVSDFNNRAILKIVDKGDDSLMFSSSGQGSSTYTTSKLSQVPSTFQSIAPQIKSSGQIGGQVIGGGSLIGSTTKTTTFTTTTPNRGSVSVIPSTKLTQEIISLPKEDTKTTPLQQVVPLVRVGTPRPQTIPNTLVTPQETTITTPSPRNLSGFNPPNKFNRSGSDFRFKLPAFGVPSFSLGAPTSSKGRGSIGSKKISGYTPSFSALAFNIRGKANKKKSYTGFELRKIPKGWNLFKSMKGAKITSI